MEFMKKFASRKFLMASASFAMSVAAIVFGEGNEAVQLAGSIGAVVSPVVYMLVEAWVDGKALKLNEYVPTVSTAVYDLVQVYEDKYGETGISNLVQDLAVVIKKNFDEEVEFKSEGTE